VTEVFAQLETKLEIGRVALGTLARVVDQEFSVFLFREKERLGSMREERIFRAMLREELLVFGDLALRSFPVHLGDFSRVSRVALVREIRGVLIPRDGILEVFLQVV
jgi:hypothetical protein